MIFQKQFEDFKKLHLPNDQFVIIGSSTLSIRGIRESSDLDVIVTESLWNNLITKYPVIINNLGIETLNLGKDIEIFNPAQSIFANSGVVTMQEIFEEADIFDGIKFVNLNHLSKIKLKMGREKDLKDIELIKQYLVQ